MQATPQDLVSLTLPEALEGRDNLEKFLELYRSSENGNDELNIFSYSASWIPADPGALAVLASGETLIGYDGPYIPVSYGIQSEINAESFQLQKQIGVKT